MNAKSQLLALTIAEILFTVGPRPLGPLYAKVCANVSLEEFNAAVSMLKRTGLAKESGHVLSSTRVPS